MYPRQIPVLQYDIADQRTLAWNEVNDAIGQSGLFEDLHEVITRQERC